MDIVLGKFALSFLILYVLFSIGSALRMYFVHSHYVHLEFAGKKWRSFGTWAPRQYRRLWVMRWLALLFIAAWLAAVFGQNYMQ